MSDEEWLLIDGNNICWKSAHAFRPKDDSGPMVAYGFLSQLATAVDRSGANQVAVFFDSDELLKRQEISPNYKQSRRRVQPDAKEEFTREVRERIRDVRDVLLPALGIINVYHRPGYEADDLIASTLRGLEGRFPVVVQSNDRDLFQLLSPTVRIWNGKAMMSDLDFQKQFGLEPPRWAYVKAIAGCISDGVQGIRNIGEITAARYLRGELTAPKPLQLIKDNQNLIEDNLKLVRLPYRGTPKIRLAPQKYKETLWRKVCEKRGFPSLRNQFPFAVKG